MSEPAPTPTPTPTPTPAPAPAPTPAPAPAPTPQPQPGGMVPSHRLREEMDLKRLALERVAELEGKNTEATTALETATSRITNMESTHAQDLSLIGMGFKDKQVQRFFRGQFKAAMSELPKEGRPVFKDWLEANKASPLFAPHFNNLTEAAATRTKETDAAGIMARAEAIKADTELNDEEKQEQILALMNPGEQEEDTRSDLDKAMDTLKAALTKGDDDDSSNTDTKSKVKGDPNAHTRPVVAKRQAKLRTPQELQAIKSRHGGRLPKEIRDEETAKMRALGMIK